MSRTLEQTRSAATAEQAPPGIEEVEANVQRKLARHDKHARVSSIAYPTLLVIALVLLWEAVTRVFSIPAFLLPAPSAVLASLAAHADLLLTNTWITTLEILFGFGLSIIVGVPLALAIFLWPPFARSVFPLLVSSQAMPKVAIAPLLLVWFGFGLLPKVLIAFLIAFFPVVINTAVGLSSIEREKIYLARSMGLSGTATFFKIRLPNALPAVFGGLKISVTLAVVGAVVGEFVGGDAGLGYLLMVANGSMDTALLFADLPVLNGPRRRALHAGRSGGAHRIAPACERRDRRSNAIDVSAPGFTRGRSGLLARFCAISCQIRGGDSGNSCGSAPNEESAAATALAIRPPTRNRTALACAFDPERIVRRRMQLQHDCANAREVARSGDKVVGKRAGEELAVLIVDQVFEKRAAKPLHHGAHGLTLQHQRIHDPARILHRSHSR